MTTLEAARLKAQNPAYDGRPTPFPFESGEQSRCRIAQLVLSKNVEEETGWRNVFVHLLQALRFTRPFQSG